MDGEVMPGTIHTIINNLKLFASSCFTEPSARLLTCGCPGCRSPTHGRCTAVGTLGACFLPLSRLLWTSLGGGNWNPSPCSKGPSK